MKKLLFAALCLVLILAALTVPSKTQYVDWTKEQLKKKSDSKLINFGVDLLGSPLLNSTSSCRNYLVASRCTSNFGELGRISAIGIFNQYIGIEGPKETK